MRYALVGNPNCGKTTIFNALTGLKQRVGNWAGVTVDKKTGFFFFKNQKIEIVDIPGIYSLSTSDMNSIDQQIAYSFIIKEKPNAIINVIDASNLNRSLYLTMQLIELELQVILVINMIDIANKKGLIIHFNKLKKILGYNILPIIAAKKIGIKELKETLSNPQKISNFNFKSYYPSLLINLSKQISIIRNNNIGNLWLTTELLNNNLKSKEITSEKLSKLKIIYKINNINIPKIRYDAINKIINNVIENKKNSNFTFTKILDTIFMNKYLGIPIFLLIIYLMFLFSITLGGKIQQIFNNLLHIIITNKLIYYLNNLNISSNILNILKNSLEASINTILGFIPQLILLFIFLSILEDSGYISRAAFIIDRFMQLIGLSGKAFVPLIIGFGCNVTSIMSARILERREDHLMTLIMSPFISCSARMAIFSVFASIFFPKNGAIIIFLLYIIGIIGAIITGYIIKFIFLKNISTPFIIDIPNYHMPSIKDIVIYTCNKLKLFLIRTGKIIIPVAIIISSLNNIYINNKTTIIEYMGKKITPILKPIGIKNNNWPATVSLITGALAKEVIIGTLNTIYIQSNNNINYTKFSILDDIIKKSYIKNNNTSNINLKFIILTKTNKIYNNLKNDITSNIIIKFESKSAAFSYLLFVLLYIPCISVIEVMIKESTIKWGILSILWSISISYVVSTISYQLLNISIYPIKSIIYIIVSIAYIILIIFLIKYLSKKINFITKFNTCYNCNNKNCS